MSTLQAEALKQYLDGVEQDYIFDISATKSFYKKGSRTYTGFQVVAKDRNSAIDKARQQGACIIGCVEVIGIAKQG